MTHPIVYAGSAFLGSSVLVLGLMQQTPSARVAEITAYGEIVQMVLIAVAPLLAAWVAWKIQQAKAAADRAAATALETLKKTEEIRQTGEATAERVNGHWHAIEQKLERSDRLVETQAALIEKLTAERAVANQAAAVALTEKVATEKAAHVKELADARAAPPIPAAPITVAPAAEHLKEIEVNTKDTADSLKGTASALKDTAAVLKDKE